LDGVGLTARSLEALSAAELVRRTFEASARPTSDDE
jgi:hypothetical protein